MLKVLIVDEDAESVETGKDRLLEAGYDCNRIDFNDLATELTTYLPDFIVLDLMNGVDPEGTGGKISFSEIWGIRFRPIVIYSSNPDLIDDMESGNANHPLVKRVKKGSGSDETLKDIINQFKPCVEGMNGITEDVNKVLNTTLRDVAQYIFAQEDISDKETAIKHMGRRRVSVLMDDSSMLRPKLHPSEQYIYPPLVSYPRTGDILIDTAKNNNSPESFFVVLTPSCDLVKVDGRNPKVTEVLCAQCEKSDVLFSKAQVKKEEDKLASELSHGNIKEYLPLPEFPGIIPAMVANMKKLRLIPFESIGKKEEGKLFTITASIDSPFREQIAWAYLSTGGRPGVPDRDCSLWAKNILDNCNDKGKKES
jgi:CTP synthase